MHRVFLLAAVAVATIGVGSVFGAEQAATDQLPAALQAADIAPSQVLNAEQADQVRGEGLRITLYGNINTNPFRGYVRAQGNAAYLNVYANAYTFAFVSY